MKDDNKLLFDNKLICLLICFFNDDALNDVKYFFSFMKCQIISNNELKVTRRLNNNILIRRKCITSICRILVFHYCLYIPLFSIIK